MEEMKIRVHSFETFGTVDGPGIRFVIFCQGCHLKCLYCHNRDQWDRNGGKEYTVKELFLEIIKYRPYFESSGGGVTASGGDPILQSETLSELFKLCQKNGIHTTLDTSGVIALTPSVKKLLSHTDLVLLDVKEIQNDRHKILTGVSNELVFKFANYLNEKDVQVWLRHVIVPGYSDFDEDCQSLASFIKTLPNIKRLDLLPFHKMGEFKWEELGENYSLQDIEAPTIAEMDHIRSLFDELEIPIVIGGR